MTASWARATRKRPTIISVSVLYVVLWKVRLVSRPFPLHTTKNNILLLGLVLAEEINSQAKKHDEGCTFWFCSFSVLKGK
jgi:hypothetical protein